MSLKTITFITAASLMDNELQWPFCHMNIVFVHILGSDKGPVGIIFHENNISM